MYWTRAFWKANFIVFQFKYSVIGQLSLSCFSFIFHPDFIHPLALATSSNQSDIHEYLSLSPSTMYIGWIISYGWALCAVYTFPPANPRRVIQSLLFDFSCEVRSHLIDIHTIYTAALGNRADQLRWAKKTHIVAHLSPSARGRLFTRRWRALQIMNRAALRCVRVALN